MNMSMGAKKEEGEIMRHWIVLAVVLVGLFGSAASAHGASAVDDPSRSHGLGIGLDLTAPLAPPNTFPASGLVGRFWIADLFGFEAAVFIVDGAPSLATRGFIKFFNSPVVDLYLGSGAAVFGSGGTLVVPLHATTGIEIRLTDRLALVSEVGLLFRGVSEVTAGLGLHFYF